MKIVRFEEIEAWKMARKLTRKVFALTNQTKFARDFDLKRQIQNAAGSAMHNVAEGFDSETNAGASAVDCWQRDRNSHT